MWKLLLGCAALQLLLSGIGGMVLDGGTIAQMVLIGQLAYLPTLVTASIRYYRKQRESDASWIKYGIFVVFVIEAPILGFVACLGLAK